MIPPLEKDGSIYSDSKDKADIFNTFFANQSSLDDSNASLSDITPVPLLVFESITFTPTEVESVLKSLKTGKAAGPDAINNNLLIELAQPLAPPLCDLLNFSLLSGKVSDIWKIANVTPIHKKNDPNDVSNYRPISVLSTIGKVIEKLVHKHVFNFFVTIKFLQPYNLVLLKVIPLLINLWIYIILFVKRLMMEQKCGRYFSILVRLSIECGTRVFYTNFKPLE